MGPPLRRRHHGLEALARVPPLPRHVLDGDREPARAVRAGASRSRPRSSASAGSRCWSSAAAGHLPADAGRRVHACPGGSASGSSVRWERYPTNWGLPRATVVERQCAARGADSCVIDVRWRNPSLGSALLGPHAARRRRRRRPDGRVRRDACDAVGGGGGRRAPAPAPRGRGRLRAAPARRDGSTRSGCWICSPRRSCTRTTSSRRSFATSRRRSSSSPC